MILLFVFFSILNFLYIKKSSIRQRPEAVLRPWGQPWATLHNLKVPERRAHHRVLFHPSNPLDLSFKAENVLKSGPVQLLF